MARQLRDVPRADAEILAHDATTRVMLRCKPKKFANRHRFESYVTTAARRLWLDGRRGNKARPTDPAVLNGRAARQPKHLHPDDIAVLLRTVRIWYDALEPTVAAFVRDRLLHQRTYRQIAIRRDTNIAKVCRCLRPALSELRERLFYQNFDPDAWTVRSIRSVLLDCTGIDPQDLEAE